MLENKRGPLCTGKRDEEGLKTTVRLQAANCSGFG